MEQTISLHEFIEKLIKLENEHPEYKDLPVVTLNDQNESYSNPYVALGNTGSGKRLDDRAVKNSNINIKYNQDIIMIE